MLEVRVKKEWNTENVEVKNAKSVTDLTGNSMGLRRGGGKRV